eukprot:503375_1
MTSLLDFQAYTTVLALFPSGCFLLIILQLISHALFSKHDDEETKSKSRKKSAKSLLYMVYGTATACGIIGFSLHAAESEKWCEKYGLIPCFCFLGLSKAILYIFFLQRAESAHGLSITPFKRNFFRYYAPAYLFVYWLIYCILTTVVFAGRLVDDGISNCVFARGAWWFSILGACIDMLNAIGSLALFIHPLLAAIRLANVTQHDRQEYIKHLGFISLMKWNIVLTTIAALSSMAALLCFYQVQVYAWFFCLGDPFVNSLCAFLMLSPNRKFMKMIFCCKCRTIMASKTEDTAKMYVMEIDGDVVELPAKPREDTDEVKTDPQRTTGQTEIVCT